MQKIKCMQLDFPFKGNYSWFTNNMEGEIYRTEF